MVSKASLWGGSDMFATTASDDRRAGPVGDAKPPHPAATTEYCAKLQQWMWQYYWGYASWQSWLALSAFPPPCGFPPPGAGAHAPGTPASTSGGGGQQGFDTGNWYSYPYPLGFPASSPHPAQTEHSSAAAPASAADTRPAQQQQQQQQNGNPAQAGRGSQVWQWEPRCFLFSSVCGVSFWVSWVTSVEESGLKWRKQAYALRGVVLR